MLLLGFHSFDLQLLMKTYEQGRWKCQLYMLNKLFNIMRPKIEDFFSEPIYMMLCSFSEQVPEKEDYVKFGQKDV